ncbi:MAG: hypothetical protein HYV33_01180 [Candidatus Kerfeldbacteria bacterium]|nr:hypothetical protein [Candidatus Kerfeldbacteria bacterium]
MNWSAKQYRWAALAIIVLAVVIRAAYFLSYHPPLVVHEGDAPAYDIPAWNIVAGNGYVYELGVPFASREPGYALYWLVPIYFVFGHSVMAVSILQLTLDVVMLGLVMLFLKRHNTAAVAVLGGLIYAIYLPFTFQNGEILTEPIYQFGLLCLVWLMTYHFTKPHWYTSGLIGVVIGAIALVRWGAVLMPPFVMLAYWLTYHQWRKVLLHGGLLIGGVLIFTMPWIVRNYLVFDQFVFGRIGGGEIYWTGSYLPYDGEWHAPTDVSRAISADLPLIESDKAFTRAALDNIRQYPLQVTWIWLKKPVKIYIFPEALNYLNRTGIRVLQLRDPTMLLLLAYAISLHWLLCGVAVLAFWWRSFSPAVLWACGVVLVFSLLLYLPLNPVPRYNVPVMPLIIILSAPILYHILQYVYRRGAKI